MGENRRNRENRKAVKPKQKDNNKGDELKQQLNLDGPAVGLLF